MNIASIVSWRGKAILHKQQISKTPELQKLRDSLEDLPNKIPDAPTVEGVKLIQKSLERLKGEDCEQFIFPEYWKSGNISLNDVLFSWKNVPSEPQAIAYYFDSEDNFMHVGRVTSEGRILSKWGVDGNVYEHEPELVPSHYGDKIIYFKQP